MAQTSHAIPSVLYNGTNGRDLLPIPIQGLPGMSTQTLVGIFVAISGNVLISFALNLQKLAHKRTQQRRRKTDGAAKHDVHLHDTVPEEPREEEAQTIEDGREQDPGQSSESESATLAETQPLIPLHSHSVQVMGDYGATTSSPDRPSPVEQSRQRRAYAPRLVPSKLRTERGTIPAHPMLAIDIVTEEAALHGLSSHNQKTRQTDHDGVDDNEAEYLKSKTWWLGFLLMNLGEVGNFISYAFAPASVVAPLGTFALIANCFFAPLMLREQFRKRDLLGVLIAIIGALTVVFASNASDTRLDADGLLHAILQIPFMGFSIVYLVGVIILATLSESKFGKRWAVIDVGLCALFGGFTVLSTKALSTLLTLQWLEMFAQWITYPLLLVLIATGVGQIRYLNRALMRFDSKTVIPIQFVLFTLSAIIGSAILYGDFKKAEFHQIVTFLYGCAATFAGIFVIAWAPSHTRHDDIGAEREEPISIPESPEQTRLGVGAIGRRRRPTLVLSSGVNGVRETTTMPGRKHGTISMGISPAQHLLLVHTPPGLPLSLPGDDDLGDTDTELGTPSPDAFRRRRTMSWYGNDAGVGSRTRDTSGQRQNGYGRVGSLETYSAHR